jgi:hypothetical protein
VIPGARLCAVHGTWARPGSGVLNGARLVSMVDVHNPKVAVAGPRPGSVPGAGASRSGFQQ